MSTTTVKPMKGNRAIMTTFHFIFSPNNCVHVTSKGRFHERKLMKFLLDSILTAGILGTHCRFVYRFHNATLHYEGNI